ncbi:MAG: hypothetical protein PQJ59_12615 [Spirochaetales bacterium]|nr:hypothetical protein [Spirochaetales bacterium]
MKKIFIITLLSLAFVCGCQSSPSMSNDGGKAENDIVELSSSEAYIAGYFSGMKYYFLIENLITGERMTLRFTNKDYIQVEDVPPGKYAIVKITGYIAGNKYGIVTPVDMIKVITVNPNEVLYLGALFKEGGRLNIDLELTDLVYSSFMSTYSSDGPMELKPF